MPNRQLCAWVFPWLVVVVPAAAEPMIQSTRIDIHVDGGRPLAGERSRFAIGPGGGVAFTYVLAAGEHACVPLGTISPDGRVRLDALSSEGTWNVEGWATYGWPFDLLFAAPDDLRVVVRRKGQPYGIDYWHRVNGRWRLESFGQGLSFGGNCVALGLMSDGRPVVLALGLDRTQIVVWERSGRGEWTATRPEALRSVAAGDFDLGVGRDGRLVVVFAPSNGGGLICATRGPGGAWRRQTLDEGRRSMLVALAMDEVGRAHVAYASGTDRLRQLRYVRLDRTGTPVFRTVAEAPPGRHVGRADISVAAQRVAIAWESGPTDRFVGKDYGGRVGSVMLTLIDAGGHARTEQLVAEHGGRPSVALAPDGQAAYVGVYTGNERGDDFYLLACALGGGQAPALARPSETPPQLFAAGCLNQIHCGDPDASRRGMERIDTSVLRSEQRAELIGQFLGSDDSVMRAYAARELARSGEALVRFRDKVRAVTHDPDPLVRQMFFAHLTALDEAADTVWPRLYESLRSPDAINRLGAAAALRNHADRIDGSELAEAARVLVSDLGNRDRVRAGSAGMALEYLGPTSGVGAVVRRALRAGDPLARSRAALVLWRWDEPVEVDRLRSVFESRDEDAQLTVCGLAGEVRTDRCVSLLEAALASRFASVRSSAVYGLRSIGMVAELKAVAKHPNGMDLLALRATDEGTPQQLTARSAAIDALVAALRHRDPNVREKACDALNRVRAEASVPGLRSLLSDPDQKVRTSARVAIGVLRGEDPSQYLVDLGAWREQASGRRRHRLNPVVRRPTRIEDGVVQVGSDKQLLIDDFVVESVRDLERRLHPFKKHPRNPVFQAQVPWEEGWVDPFMSTVLYDEDERTFKMWYRCGPRHSLAGFAVSEDGLHWVRPDIASEPWGEYAHHNLVGYEGRIAIWKHAGRNVVRRPELDAPKRYSSLFYRHDKQYVVSYSPDGTWWTTPRVARAAFGDVVSILWDPARQRYLYFPKYMKKVDGFVRRSFAASELADFDAAAGQTMAFVASRREDAHVADGASRAFGSLLRDVLAPRQFHSEIYSVTALTYEGVVVALYDFWPVIGSREGPLDMLMKVSRDMVHWEDVDLPRRSLAIGRFGEWDSGMVYGPNTMLVVDDEIRLYYLGANMGHCTKVLPMTRPYHTVCLGLATLRLDGFASLRAGDGKGSLTTKPLVFVGNELRVNAACGGGSLGVELLDDRGRTIGGYGRAECDVFSGDDLDHRVSWNGKHDLGALAGRTVKLRFHLRAGDLYAFGFH